MEARRSFGTFSRILKPLVALFARRAPQAVPAPRGVVRSVAAMPSPLSEPALAAPRQAERVAAPPVAAAPAPVAPIAVHAMPAATAPPENTQAADKPLRTLAEVRADLARLREQSRERQAQARIARPDVTFPATDFMEFVPSKPERRREQEDAGESFAPTAYLDFTVLKSR